jgi:hypothetical protein
VPTLLRHRPAGAEMAIVLLGPLVLGAIAGFFLGENETIYLVVSLVGILGGLAAGLEHEGALEGFYRGLLGGLLFGFSILLTHGLRDVEPKAELPDPEVLLIAITAVAGALLGALGGRLRVRRERRAGSAS